MSGFFFLPSAEPRRPITYVAFGENGAGLNGTPFFGSCGLNVGEVARFTTFLCNAEMSCFPFFPSAGTPRPITYVAYGENGAGLNATPCFASCFACFSNASASFPNETPVPTFLL